MFVCRRNSCRSQMAEGFARSLGAGKIAVSSSGLEASLVHPTAIKVMAEVHLDLTKQTSDALSTFNAEDFDIVISMCGCGTSLPEAWLIRERFEDWDIEDPDGKPLAIFRAVRDQIKEKVQQLVASSVV